MGYEVSVDNGAWRALSATAGPGATRLGTVAGLSAGSHTFQVRAFNGNGAGASDGSNTSTAPLAVTGSGVESMVRTGVALVVGGVLLVLGAMRVRRRLIA